MNYFNTILFAMVISISFAQFHTGTGTDGNLYVPSETTVTINTTVTNTSGNNPAGAFFLMVVSPDGFAPDEEILIITMQDPTRDFSQNQAGRYEFARIQSITPDGFQLYDPLIHDFLDSETVIHQVIRVGNYSEVTVDGTLTCPSWDGQTGGILVFRNMGTLLISETGVIDASGKGYDGGTQYGSSHGGGQGGESYIGIGGNGGNYNYNDAQEGAGGGGAAYANYPGARGWAGGGGGGTAGSAGIGSPTRGGAGGGGGGHAGSGGGAGYGTNGFGGYGYANQCVAEDGGDQTSGDGCVNYTGGGGGGGGSYGQEDLSLMYLGSGGGCAGRHDGYTPGFGGNGGGILFISTNELSNFGSIQSNGADGGNGSTYSGGGGGGAGGSLFLSANTIENSGLLSASGGNGGSGYYGNPGGAGGFGITRIDVVDLSGDGTISPDPFLGPHAFGIFHEQLANTNDDLGPYTLSADIYDEQGDPITSASVFYRVNGGAFNEIVMSTDNDTLFTVDIPGQLVNSVIDYYLTATDGTDEYVTPSMAPAFYFSFQITGFPPQNLTITDNFDLTVNLSWEPPVETMNLIGYSIYRSEVENFTPGSSNLVVDGLTDTSFTDSGLSDFHTYYYQVSANFDYDGLMNYNFTDGSIIVDNPDITTLHGYVFLEGQTNHANIKIKLHPVSPSAQADSTYTNALGHFEFDIFPGVYDITYEKSAYSTYQPVTNQSIISDLDLGESTLSYLGNTNISGSVSGIWDGVYTIVGNITVDNGDSLFIMPGSELRFQGNYYFSINGYLSAIGAEGDSIIFRPLNIFQSYGPGDWQGIDFNDDSDDNSIIRFAVVEYAVDGIYWGESNATVEDSRIHHCSGSGLYISGDTSDPMISRLITHNNSGNGLYSYNGDGTFDHIYSHHNSIYGAYFEYYAHVTVTNSQFNQNSSHGVRVLNNSWPSFDNCEINDNNNWGIRIDYSSPLFENTIISGNAGYGVRYNNDNNTWSTPQFDNCLVEDNSSHGISLRYRTTANSYITNCTIRNNGSVGIYLEYDCDPIIENNRILSNNSTGIYINNNSYNDPQIIRNVIAYNHGDGIYKNYTGSPQIIHNTIYANWNDGININSSGTEILSHNIIVNNGGYGINDNSAIESFEYNLIMENLTAPFSNLGNLPADSWDFVSFNANGDTADIYLNISEPAQFVFSDSTDFSLQINSPAVNAGDPAILDPDETPADLGVYYFDFGNPRNLTATGYSDQSVDLVWDSVDRDSLTAYNVYFRTADSLDYTYWGNTTDTSVTVNGLEDNTLHQFTVSSQFQNTESVFATPVTEKPGAPGISMNPNALNFEFDSDPTLQAISVTNTGTRDLDVDFLMGTENNSTYFDGNGDYIHIGDFGNLGGMSALTVECWIKRYNSGHFEFVSKHYLRYSLYIDSANHLGIYKGYDSGNNLYQNWTSTWELPENEWHHVAVTWTGNTVKFYADGELVDTRNDALANPIPTGGYNFQLGRRADYNGYWLNGNLAEVRVWNIVRTEADIARWKDSALNGDETGLVGYWPLHNDYADHSVWGRNGTNYGNTYISSDSPPTLPLLPFTMPMPQFTLEPGGNMDIDLQFYEAGLEGTQVFTTPIVSNSLDNPWMDYEISVTYNNQIPSTPIHFSPVAPTGLPYTIVVTNTTIDGETLGVGDEIAVFDGDLCVGAGVFDGTFNYVITAWQGDEGQGLAGFTPGDAIEFGIYDNSADLEATVTPEYSIGNGTFGYGQFTAVSLASTIYQIQNIPVEGGLFNLISFNLLPRYSAASVVFDGLENLRIVYNDTGAALIPEYGINSIGDIDFRDGFHLYSTVSDTIHYEGIAITPSEWFITVSANQWNSIAFLGNTPLDVTAAFPDTLIDSISIVQTFDGTVWIPALGVNTMTNLLPGYGYQIALSGSEDISFTYQTGGGMARPLAKEILEPVHFRFTQSGLPYTVVADIPETELANWQSGDELAVFDNDKCVGAAVFDGSSRMTVTAWGSNPVLDLTGFTEGDEIQLTAYHQVTDQETAVFFSSLNGNSRFGMGDYAYGEISGSSLLPTEFELRQNYPNPFNPVTNIEFAVPHDSQVTITVYSLTGRQVV
ncbi:MAG: right-handed parallel beta-helix repeat-containing protein, partial [Fidelibacterota bacterium]